MDEDFKKYILGLNVKIVNPIRATIRNDSDIVGWHCVSTSNLRYPKHIELINDFIEKNGVGYNVVSDFDTSLSFFIYK